MRIIVLTLGICAAIIMCAVSAAMNYLFLSSLGKTALEGYALGAASAAGDVLKALLPFYIAWCWHAGRYVAVCASSLSFAFFAAFSFLSAIGFAADNRLAFADRRDEARAASERMQHDLRAEEARRAALPKHRPAAVVVEAINQHRQNRRWLATNECQAATEPQSREFCTVYFGLRSELAAGESDAALVRSITELHREAERLRAQGAGSAQDPQVTMLSRISGLGAEPVRLALIVAVALLVEIGASLGLFLAGGHVVGDGSAKAKEDKAVGSVQDFCLSALRAERGATMEETELYAAFKDWCSHSGRDPLMRSDFTATFAELAEIVGIRRDAARYVNISPVRAAGVQEAA